MPNRPLQRGAALPNGCRICRDFAHSLVTALQALAVLRLWMGPPVVKWIWSKLSSPYAGGPVGALLGSLGGACEGEAVHHVWLVTAGVSQGAGQGRCHNLTHDAGVTAIQWRVSTAGDRHGRPE